MRQEHLNTIGKCCTSKAHEYKCTSIDHQHYLSYMEYPLDSFEISTHRRLQEEDTTDVSATAAEEKGSIMHKEEVSGGKGYDDSKGILHSNGPFSCVAWGKDTKKSIFTILRYEAREKYLFYQLVCPFRTISIGGPILSVYSSDVEKSSAKGEVTGVCLVALREGCYIIVRGRQSGDTEVCTSILTEKTFSLEKDSSWLTFDTSEDHSSVTALYGVSVVPLESKQLSYSFLFLCSSYSTGYIKCNIMQLECSKSHYNGISHRHNDNLSYSTEETELLTVLKCLKLGSKKIDVSSIIGLSRNIKLGSNQQLKEPQSLQRIKFLICGTLRCCILKTEFSRCFQDLDIQLYPIGSRVGQLGLLYDVACATPPEKKHFENGLSISIPSLPSAQKFPLEKSSNELSNSTEFFICTRPKHRLWISNESGVVQTTLKLAIPENLTLATSTFQQHLDQGLGYINYLCGGKFITWTSNLVPFPLSIIGLDSVSIIQTLTWPWEDSKQIIGYNWNSSYRCLELIVKELTDSVCEPETKTTISFIRVFILSSYLPLLMYQLKAIIDVHYTYRNEQLRLIDSWLPSFHHTIKQVLDSSPYASCQKCEEIVSPELATSSFSIALSQTTNISEFQPTTSSVAPLTSYSSRSQIVGIPNQSTEIKEISSMSNYLASSFPSLDFSEILEALCLSKNEECYLLEIIVRLIYNVVQIDGTKYFGSLLPDVIRFTIYMEKLLTSALGVSTGLSLPPFPTPMICSTTELNIFPSTIVAIPYFTSWKRIFQTRLGWRHYTDTARKKTETMIHNDIINVSDILQAFHSAIKVVSPLMPVITMYRHLEHYNSLFDLIDEFDVLRTHRCRAFVLPSASGKILPPFRRSKDLINLLCKSYFKKSSSEYSPETILATDALECPAVDLFPVSGKPKASSVIGTLVSFGIPSSTPKLKLPDIRNGSSDQFAVNLASWGLHQGLSGGRQDNGQAVVGITWMSIGESSSYLDDTKNDIFHQWRNRLKETFLTAPTLEELTVFHEVTTPKNCSSCEKPRSRLFPFCETSGILGNGRSEINKHKIQGRLCIRRRKSCPATLRSPERKCVRTNGSRNIRLNFLEINQCLAPDETLEDHTAISLGFRGSDKQAIEYIRILKAYSNYKDLDICIAMDWLPGILHIAMKKPRLFRSEVRQWLIHSAFARLLKERSTTVLKSLPASKLKSQAKLSTLTPNQMSFCSTRNSKFSKLKSNNVTTPISLQTNTGNSLLVHSPFDVVHPTTDQDHASLFSMNLSQLDTSWIFPLELQKSRPMKSQKMNKGRPKNIWRSTDIQLPPCKPFIQYTMKTTTTKEMKIQLPESAASSTPFYTTARLSTKTRAIRLSRIHKFIKLNGNGSRRKQNYTDIWTTFPQISELLSNILLQQKLLTFQSFLNVTALTDRAASVMQWVWKSFCFSNPILSETHFPTKCHSCLNSNVSPFIPSAFLFLLTALQRHLQRYPVLSLHFNSFSIEVFRDALLYKIYLTSVRYHNARCLADTSRFIPTRLSYRTFSFFLSKRFEASSSYLRLLSQFQVFLIRYQLITSFRPGDFSTIDTMTRHLRSTSASILTEDVCVVK